MNTDAHRAVSLALREHYSRVLAWLAAQYRDVARAEDALSESLVAALAQWPVTGVPKNPAAWLLTVARRRMSDALRRDRLHASAQRELAIMSEEKAETMEDRRLQLLFACAHPAIDRSVRAPLMLQIVFGLEASAIAALFLTSPDAMAQRLVRAKRKIRDAGIPFQIPEADEYPERLGNVLTAIYALFSAGYNALDTSDRDDSPTQEALWLGHVVVKLSRRNPEALGLLALMLFIESRGGAQRDGDGRYVPLSEQKTSLWDQALIARAEALLHEAAKAEAPGRYQYEAAIQSAHAMRARTGETDWRAILMLYDALLACTRDPVVAINRALALLHVRSAQEALAALDDLATDPRLLDYQPYWAARAHILSVSGNGDEARAVYARAIALEHDPAARAHLVREKSKLEN